ncbi:MAG TPA: nucleoside-diphosphate kinase [Candidatus Aminicenantes bacterium]|nr:nucleoside-diphosphate kinase [Candidatus Aminicenantes bacterium]
MRGPIELTLVMVKPDAMQRRLLGTIIRRLERKGLVMVAGDLRQLSRDTAASHYATHQGKDFYQRLLKFITSGPVFVSVWRGPQAIQRVRTLVGATSPDEAHPGTIRGDFALHITQNLVHASDSLTSAGREIALFFPDEDFFDITAVDADLLSPPE